MNVIVEPSTPRCPEGTVTVEETTIVTGTSTLLLTVETDGVDEGMIVEP